MKSTFKKAEIKMLAMAMAMAGRMQEEQSWTTASVYRIAQDQNGDFVGVVLFKSDEAWSFTYVVSMAPKSTVLFNCHKVVDDNPIRAMTKVAGLLMERL